MSEFLPSPEPLANEQHALLVVEEIDRILTDVPVRQGLSGHQNHSAPRKVLWHDGLLFFQYPEGENNVDDPTVMNIAIVCYDNPDGSRNAYTVEESKHGSTKQLTQTIYPARKEPMQLISPFFSLPNEMLEITRQNIATVQAQQLERIADRKVGNHLADVSEADILIARLRATRPAS